MTKMKTTTLNRIRAHRPCGRGWSTLLRGLNKKRYSNDKLSFKLILEINGIQDAVWCLRTLVYNEQRLFMADVAESVLHLYENNYPNDDFPRKAIQAARDFSLNIHDLKAVSDSSIEAAKDAVNDYFTLPNSLHFPYAAYAAASVIREHTTAYDVACDAVGVYKSTINKNQKWNEIEQLFIKHFCQDDKYENNDT